MLTTVSYLGGNNYSQGYGSTAGIKQQTDFSFLVRLSFTYILIGLIGSQEDQILV